MIPGDTIRLGLYVATTGGSPVTGKVAGDFSLSAILNGASVAMTVISSVEIGSGWYELRSTLPAQSGFITIIPVQGANVCDPKAWQGEIETNDLDTIGAKVTRPLATVTDTVSSLSNINFSVVANRYNPITLSVQSGIDYSAWDTIKFSVWDATHSGSIYTLAIAGPLPAPVNGVTAITFNIPEDAAFYSRVNAAITAGQTSTQLVWDLIGNEGGQAAKTRTIVYGNLTLFASVGPAT